MKKDIMFYKKLFTSVFIISSVTFGGGYVMIPLLRKKFAAELRWLKEQEIMDLTAIAQSAPGGLAVNVSIIIGYRLAGIKGALVSVTAMVIPPFTIISIVSVWYEIVQDNLILSIILRGMQIGVAAVIFDVSIDMALDIIKQRKWIPIMMLFITFILSYFLELPILILIAAGAVIGIIGGKYNDKKGENL